MNPTPRFTNHALDKMEEREISREEVIVALESPLSVTIGATAVEFEGVVQGRELHIVAVRDSDPLLVITVWEKDQ